MLESFTWLRAGLEILLLLYQYISEKLVCLKKIAITSNSTTRLKTNKSGFIDCSH